MTISSASLKHTDCIWKLNPLAVYHSESFILYMCTYSEVAIKFICVAVCNIAAQLECAYL